ncbi:MAG: membrane protein [Flavobacteriales bacterium]|jgi:membrane protein
MARELKDRILEHRFTVGLIQFSKKLVLPGFDGISAFEVSKFFIKGIVDGAISTRSGALAYSFFLAIFPAIIFLFTLIPYIPVETFHDELFGLMAEVLPAGVFEAIETTLSDIINKPRGGLLSLGFVLAMVFATNGVSSMMVEFNHTIHSNAHRSFIKHRWVALCLTLTISVLLILAIVLVVLSKSVNMFFVEQGYISSTVAEWLAYSRWGILIALLFFGISFLYYFGPVKKTRYRFFSPGGILATVLIIVTSVAFSYYVGNFAQYNKLYGSIGTLIIILLWININSLSLLLGFELNASITKARNENKDTLDSSIYVDITQPLD